MAAVVSLGEVQAWLETSKLNLAALPTALEESERATVLGRLAQVYDVGGWITEAATPALVRKIIAMRVAGWTYNRQYSQEAATLGDSYGNLLLRSADMLLDQIVEGHIGIPEEEVLVGRGQPRFMKTDPIFALDWKP
jgi:hypothetical protein